MPGIGPCAETTGEGEGEGERGETKQPRKYTFLRFLMQLGKAGDPAPLRKFLLHKPWEGKGDKRCGGRRKWGTA